MFDICVRGVYNHFGLLDKMSQAVRTVPSGGDTPDWSTQVNSTYRTSTKQRIRRKY